MREEAGSVGTMDITTGTLILDGNDLSTVRGFIDNGADPATPAAIIENGTRAGQRVVTGTLESLADKSTASDIKSPALIIIGSVVTLQDKLSWFSDTGLEHKS